MRVRCLAIFAALGVAASASGQPQAPTFRANTNVIQVDARVFQDGHFVTGLGPADFVLTEDGVPQTIQSVVLIGAPPGPALAAASAPAPLAAAGASAPLAPSAPSTWLFVFDTPHLTPAGLTHTRDAVLQFLDAKWHQGDIGGVVVDGKMANNRLTSDRVELRAAVAAVKMPGNMRSVQLEMTREWPRFQDEYEVLAVGVDANPDATSRVVARACQEDPTQCRNAEPEVRDKALRLAGELQRSTLVTLSTVQALANGLSRMPGPKTVVFLSEGFVAEKLEDPIRQAVGDAARAGAHFYTIDARGLNKGNASSSIIDQPLAESLAGRTVHFDALADATNSLAVDTGGFAVRNENNFGRALDEIQRDAGTYYVIGYSSTNTKFDGKYRAINVSVKRPGVTVRARRGYLALATAMLLEPHAVSSAKGAAPDLPNLPATPGVLAVMPGSPAEASAAASAMRARMESGVQTLRKFGVSDAADGYAERGWTAYQRGDVETAERELSAAVSAGNKPWISYVLGYTQYAQRKYPAAADAWMRVNKAVPEFEPVYFNLADALSLQGQEQDAIKILQVAERRWPKDAEVEDAIGVIEVRRIALDAAIKSFDRATKLAPSDPVGYFNLGRAHQMRWSQDHPHNAADQQWRQRETYDRESAIAAYTRYLQLGGPYADLARSAIATLQAKKH